MDNVIYFPYIRVPNNEWFTRTLLYWDHVSSIIPMEYASDPSRLDEYSHSLVQEGLLRPIVPLEYIDKIPNFTEAFLSLVDAAEYPIHRGSIENKATFQVHMEKLGPIADELCNRGLARESGWPWYEIEAFTADQFMAYLAAVLGDLPEIKSHPITDRTQNIASFWIHSSMKTDEPQEIDKLRMIVLQDILPAPAGGAPVTELAKFKADHKRELVRFRNRVEAHLISTAAIADSALREASIKQFIKETRNSVEELSELMHERGWRRISLGRFLAYATAVTGVASAVASGGLVGVVAAAFGVGSAIYDTIQRAKAADILEGKYAAYAVLTQEMV